MKPTQPPPDAPNWQSRINVALSVLHQRPACARTAELAQAALNGATVQDLFDMERLGIGLGEL